VKGCAGCGVRCTVFFRLVVGVKGCAGREVRCPFFSVAGGGCDGVCGL